MSESSKILNVSVSRSAQVRAKSIAQIGSQYARIARETKEREMSAATSLDFNEAARQRERRERARRIAVEYQNR